MSSKIVRLIMTYIYETIMEVEPEKRARKRRCNQQDLLHLFKNDRFSMRAGFLVEPYFQSLCIDPHQENEHEGQREQKLQ